jgi:putative pyruvate formate lyase activating enzyme
MAKLSKRDFLKSCFLLSVPGAASLLAPLTAGCNRGGQEPAAPENRTDRQPAQPKPDRKSPARISRDFQAAYLRLHETGELKKRADDLWKIMESCELCPRMCGVNKIEGNKGFCQASAQLRISSYHPHFGEERPLVGKGGSGTIFLTNCGLRCVFCINWEVSQGGQGRDRDVEDMANMMIRLQERGCHNINVVTPTHYSPHIVRALDIAAAKGLRLPLVYNTCGWERVEILKMLDGIVDIYLPDFKYADGKMAAKYSSNAESYPEVTKAALLEMHRQVGVAKPAEDGLMYRGLMIRHLVMPNRVSGTQEVFLWIGENLPKDTYLNIMAQYRPMYKASEYPDIARRLTREEYSDAVGWAKEAGLTNLDIQGYRL